MLKTIKGQSGQSLIEAIVAMAVFSLISISLASLTLSSYAGLMRSGNQIRASSLADEAIEALKSVKETGWNTVTNTPGVVSISGSHWTLSSGESQLIDEKFTRTIIIDNVCRDVSNNIAACPAAYTDAHSKKATATVSWEESNSVTNTVRRVAYIANWDSRDWAQTDWSGGGGQAIWLNGSKYDTADATVNTSSIGSAQLASTPDGSWSLSNGSIFTDTSDTDFSQGTNSDTVISGAGIDASIFLAQGMQWNLNTDTGSETWNAALCTSETNCWAVGSSGALAQYDGTSWTESTVPSSANINAIYANAQNDIWAVGASGRIWHYNGAAWLLNVDMGSNTWYGLTCTSSTNCWATGSGGTLAKYNGANWTASTIPSVADINSIYANSQNDIWAVGASGRIWHYNGAAWSLDTTIAGRIWYGLACASSTNCWAVGSSGALCKYSNAYKPTGSFTSRVFDGGRADAAWNTFLWTENLPAGSNVVVASRSGDNLVPDGTWSGWSANLTNPAGSAITSPSGRYFQYQLTLTRATVITESPQLDDITIIYNIPTSQNLFAIYANSQNDIWAAGAAGTIIHYDGTAWSPNATVGSGTWYGLACTSSTNCWAVGSSGTLARYDGTDWTASIIPSPTNIMAIRANSANDIWAVGASGRIWHYDGAAWLLNEDTGSNTWYGLTCTSSTNCWAAGSAGRVAQYDGAIWTESNVPSAATINAIYANAEDDIWTAGSSGRIWHYDGTEWLLDTTIGGQVWTSVSCASSTSCFAAGNGGALVRWLGAGWNVVASPTTRDLNALTFINWRIAWAAGDTGALIRFDRGALYQSFGTLVSSAFNMGNASPVQVVEWDESKPANTGIQIQIRTAPDSGGSPGVWTSWYGASGAGTYFTDHYGALASTDLNGKQWVQYQVQLSGDGSDTPQLNEVRINYK